MQENLLATRSAKPYLIRAIYDWAHDEGHTPQILVDTSCKGVSLPLEYAKDMRMVLNLHDSAVRDLTISNDKVCFSTRFNGAAFLVEIPIIAVLAIYGLESGMGLSFSGDSGLNQDQKPLAGEQVTKPKLRLVK